MPEETTNDSAKQARKRILRQYEQVLLENAGQASRLHDQFLTSRHESLQQVAGLLQAQAEASGAGLSVTSNPERERRLVYNRSQLEEFASGSVEASLGKEFAVYRGRRLPRIPNGDLLLMNRVPTLAGQRLVFDGQPTITVEYDVPPDAWYLINNSYPDLPYSVLMEIVLQPCGMLTAHLGSSLLFPQQEYFFRNLDGEARLLQRLDVRGKTIQTTASLVKHMVSGTMIIQSFDFSLSCAGQPVYTGNSTFGFFPPEAMANQLGLDGGNETLPLYEQVGQSGLAGHSIRLADSSFYQAEIGRPFYRLPDGKMKFISEAFISPQGGRNGMGYVYARKPVDATDWFFSNHFYQDPVMPGSLGVEAILEAIQLFALHQDLGKAFVSPRFDLLPEEPMTWKYRGQILRTTGMMKLEVHLTSVEKSAGQVILRADASLWADRIRIYELKGAAVRLVEG